MHPGLSIPRLNLKTEKEAALPAIDRAVPRPPMTAPTDAVRRTPSSVMWVNQGTKKPVTPRESNSLPRKGASETPAGSTRTEPRDKHSLSNWPRKARPNRDGDMRPSGATAEAAQPPLVLELEAFMRRELFQLDGTPHGVFDRIPIIGETFNALIDHFVEYRELLSFIKKEYDLAVGEGLAAVQEIHRLRTDQASQRQYYTYVIDSEKGEMESVMRRMELRVKEAEDKAKTMERDKNSELCKRMEADVAYETQKAELDDMTQRCRLLSDTLLTENLRQSMLVQQGKKLKTDNDRLQRVCESLENRIKNEPLISESSQRPSVIDMKGLRRGDRVASIARQLVHNATDHDDVMEATDGLRAKIARLQQMLINERMQRADVEKSLSELQHQRDEEAMRARVVAEKREQRDRDRKERETTTALERLAEQNEYREAIDGWIDDVRTRVAGYVTAATGKKKSKKKITRRSVSGAADADPDAPGADVEALLQQLPTMVKGYDDGDKSFGDSLEAEERAVADHLPWTPRPAWNELQKVLPKFRLDRDIISSKDIFERLKSTIQAEIAERDVQSLTDNMRKWLGKENLTDEEVGGMANKHFIGRGTGPHVPVYLRHHGPVRNRRLTKGAVEDLLKDFWDKRKSELRVEGQLEVRSIQEFFMAWLLDKSSSTLQAITLAYNILDVCEANQSDPDCNMFLSILNGHISEAVFHDQLSIVERLQFVMETRDKKENRGSGGRAMGILHKASVHKVLRKFFPAKSTEDMLKLRFTLVPFTDDRGYVDYERVFEEDTDGNQTRFVELLREQHLWEVQEFMVDVEEAVMRNATVSGHEKVNLNQAHNALKELDRLMPNDDIDKIIAYAAKVTDTQLSRLPPSHTVPLHEFLSRLRSGELLKRHTPKEMIEERQEVHSDSDEDAPPSHTSDDEEDLHQDNLWGDDGIDYAAIDAAVLEEAETTVSGNHDRRDSRRHEVSERRRATVTTFLDEDATVQRVHSNQSLKSLASSGSEGDLTLLTKQDDDSPE